MVVNIRKSATRKFEFSNWAHGAWTEKILMIEVDFHVVAAVVGM